MQEFKLFDWVNIRNFWFLVAIFKYFEISVIF